MSESVKMPALGESVTEGTVTRWLKAVGDQVAVDEPLLEVSTDKVDTEVPSPIAGVLEQILVPEDTDVAVGTDLAIIGDGSGSGAAAAQAPAAEAAAAEVPAPAAEPPAAAAPSPAPQPATPDAAGTEVLMPALGESVTEGTVTRWLKAVGDQVAVDEPLLEVSTDKVDTEVPSPAAGTLLEIRVAEDADAAVGDVLAVIGTQAAAPVAAPAPAAPAASTPVASAAPAPAPAPAPAAAPATPAPAAGGAGGYVTPIVRRLAAEKGVDLSTVTGTGIGGRIRKEDVLQAAEAQSQAAAAPAPAASPSAPAEKKAAAVPAVDTLLRGKTEKMTRLRQVIAERMMTSLQTSAQLTTVVEVDVTRVAAVRAKAKAKFEAAEGTKLTFLPFFIKAATEALKAHPKINATIDGKEVKYHAVENIGIAVDTPRGLLVPVIKEAGDLTLGGIAKKLNDLAARTREGAVGPDELSGSTFTITNTGSGGALFDTPIINSPEVAILGVGTIVKRPMVVKDAEGNETIGIRSMVYLALSYDHRLIDGADAARYLMTVKKRLEEGAFEAEAGLA
ncbi:2-oxoglutarate dehydrogenase, E2 component, dihydrolipoamide succinyltransferase [Buchananella hordeovulneris]|uniref:2-oxoglutarate dehydrogenase, E2 component, dihydrolipoamide succinyltransferase n=1 Tax=Buchananella hordeovulneris TaxID=52770 RepID=UPI0026DC61FA|nr:2-oxoglutarate dehydrogenase, E2 component, dihydrolipoamide succinyltransferase [Buchananella hordeovulneris]MDO5081176.1 2-oxoglutarate dehydrogenase, E2 component, dihydrolipoamide succinyltransferase [Buchananella hordeovulneris]